MICVFRMIGHRKFDWYGYAGLLCKRLIVGYLRTIYICEVHRKFQQLQRHLTFHLDFVCLLNALLVYDLALTTHLIIIVDNCSDVGLQFRPKFLLIVRHCLTQTFSIVRKCSTLLLPHFAY